MEEGGLTDGVWGPEFYAKIRANKTMCQKSRAVLLGIVKLDVFIGKTVEEARREYQALEFRVASRRFGNGTYDDIWITADMASHRIDVCVDVRDVILQAWGPIY
jgi:hypothetical protein